MIIVLLAISICLIIAGAIILSKFSDEAGIPITILGVICTIISVIATLVLVGQVAKLRVIDEKIEMYEEQNIQIESQIAECVKQYQEYEGNIITEVKPESYITLVSLYPELKADALVSKQIEIYISNNEKIKELKEFKIDGSTYRWWLYFG